MKIYKQYSLLKELPELPAGTILYWDLWEERYTELSYIGMNNKPKVSYKLDFINAHHDWFKPTGKAEELYQKFPTDFIDEHFYPGELRHNKMCRFCHDAYEVLGSKEYEEKVTEIFKEIYERKIESLNVDKSTTERK